MTHRILLTLISILFFLNAATAQDAPQIQQSLITKITATWCPNCGGWAWPFFKDIYTDNKDKALVIAAHRSGDLQNIVATSFESNFNVNYQPFFIVGNVNQNVTPGNAAARRTSIKNLVDANYLMEPVVNAGLSVSKNGNMLHVQTKTRFFQNADGEYYLGVYVIEDGVINAQVGQGDNAVHTNVLRAGMSSNSFGELLVNGSVSEGAEFENQFSIQIGNWNEDNLIIGAIIWKKNGASYEFVNTNFTDDISTTGIATIPEDEINFRIFPSPASGSATIELSVNNASETIQLELTDISGKRLKTIFEGNPGVGVHTFEVDRTSAGASGVYFVMLRRGNAVATKRIVFQ